VEQISYQILIKRPKKRLNEAKKQCKQCLSRGKSGCQGVQAIDCLLVSVDAEEAVRVEDVANDQVFPFSC